MQNESIFIVQSTNSGRFFVVNHDVPGPARELESATLPGAVREADNMGLRATHWISRDNNRSEIPSGIVRGSVGA